MFNWFGTAKKPDVTQPDKNEQEGPATTKSSDTEYLQHLKTTQNKLDKFNKDLLNIHTSVKSLLENSSSIDKIADVHKTLDSQIGALYKDMESEVTRIGVITQVKLSGGRSRKTNRRHSKTNRRRRKH
jgi:hypothetical protein